MQVIRVEMELQDVFRRIIELLPDRDIKTRKVSDVKTLAQAALKSLEEDEESPEADGDRYPE